MYAIRPLGVFPTWLKMTFAHAQKYFSMMAALTSDWSLCSSKKVWFFIRSIPGLMEQAIEPKVGHSVFPAHLRALVI
jgi:hypothetical protein